MSIRPKTHARAEAKHSQRRAAERYSEHLTKKDIADIGKIVLSPNRENKVFMHQQDDGCSHWLVRFKDTIYRLVFDERTSTPRTFLDMRPVDDMLWRKTHDHNGHPTMGDIARISRLRLK